MFSFRLKSVLQQSVSVKKCFVGSNWLFSTNEKPKLLFLCVANSCRSQMAEALGKKYLSHLFDVYSAGSVPTKPNQNAIKLLQENGFDTSSMTSKHFNDILPPIKYAIFLCHEEELKGCPKIGEKQAEYHLSWTHSDPVKDGNYINVFQSIKDKILLFKQEQEEQLDKKS